MNTFYSYDDNGRLLPSIPPENSAESVLPFVTAYLSTWEAGKQRQFMNVCERYYNNETDVLEKVRTVIGRDEENNPILKKSNVLSNNKLCHNFLQKLTKQKLGYVISKPFTIDLDDPDNNKGKQMIADVKEYYTKSFHKM